ncbi:RHS repeat-associated core domain-containing protein [Reyranella soli]|uniref:RHS repeat-associated core domain-containing protein n=1 Tax=Reyranella soli TaxID=1230389 RepID=UPI0011BEA0CF
MIASFDSGTGALTKFGYQPYGNSAAAATPFGYTGQRFDQESGLYYYRARHYSAKWGRFLQADPLGPEWSPTSSSDSHGTYSGSTYSLPEVPSFPDNGFPVVGPFVVPTSQPTIGRDVALLPTVAPSLPAQSEHFQPTLSIQLGQPSATALQQFGSQHLYAYVSNDPLNLIDPLGLAELAASQPPVRTPCIGGLCSQGGSYGNGGLFPHPLRPGQFLCDYCAKQLFDLDVKNPEDRKLLDR